jgi:hypothetical protein
MKSLVISLFLFISINAQDGVTRFFVDNTATGSNNGTSWANAWETFGAIDWTDLSDADTIYISGGSGDSLVYAMYTTVDPDPDISFTAPIVICPSWENAHNGKVVFTTTNNTQLHLLLVRGLSGVKFTGLTFMDLRDGLSVVNGLVAFGDLSNEFDPVTGRIHIDNCRFIGNGGVGNLNFECHDTVIVSNSISEYLENDWVNEADPLTFTSGGGYILIEGNTIIQRNTNVGTDAHRDMVQFNLDNGAGENMDIVIRNNFILQDGDSASSWNAFVYNSVSAIDTLKWYIYNNIMVSNTTGSNIGGLFIYNSRDSTDGGTQSSNNWIFNNTIIIADDGSGASMPLGVGNNSYYKTDTVFVQNNLIIVDAPISMYCRYPSFFGQDYYRRIDYNGYYEYGGMTDPFYTGEGFGSYSYAQWKDPANFSTSDQYDDNTITGNSTAVSFTNKFGENITDYYTTTGRDLGVNIGSAYPYLLAKFPDIENDILGNPRSGTWDIGCLEYQGTVGTPTRVRMRQIIIQ